MKRRDLLAGAAGLGASGLAGGALGKTVRPAPELRSADLVVAFDRVSALPVSYAHGGWVFAGAAGSGAIQAIVCRLAPRNYATADVVVAAVAHSADAIRFSCQVSHQGQIAAGFDQVYRIDGASLVLTLEHVVEHPGFELIELALPDLVAVTQTLADAWMAEGRNGGSFVRLVEAKAMRLDDDDNFGRISIQLPVGMVGAGGSGCVMEVQGYMDGTETVISGPAGARRASLGTVQVHRVHGGRCYTMNDGGDAVCGGPGTPNLIVGQTPTTRFDFFNVVNRAQPWLDGARLLAARMPRIPTDYYADKLLYIIAGKNKTEAEPRTTFAQSGDLIAKVARLTDHAPQLAYISGWVYDGQDTGYPSEDKINASLGTYEDLRQLMERGRAEWNANVTVNVNYDDAYKSSPIFDPGFIARRPDGKLWASRAWDGETSYIVGMAKFMQGGWGSRRIRYTVDRYRIRDAMLVDAMSWFAIRNDWDPAHPASGHKNLVDGKFALVSQAKALGVDIASEQLRYPFIGRLSQTMNGPTASDCPFGGKAVPLAATVYRRAAIWGDDGGGSFDPGPNLFWNNRPSQWFQGDSDPTRIAEFYFLVTLPFGKLHDLAVVDYSHEGGLRRLSLDGGAQITLADDGKTYAAVHNGATIARNGATACPIDTDRIAFFAREAQSLGHPLPAGWRADEIVARALDLHQAVPVKANVVAGTVTVEVPARCPVIVYRNAAVAASHG
jgi:hypothetical protein